MTGKCGQLAAEDSVDAGSLALKYLRFALVLVYLVQHEKMLLKKRTLNRCSFIGVGFNISKTTSIQVCCERKKYL